MEKRAQTALRKFFEPYAVAAQAAEPEALATMYAPTFIVAGPRGSTAFANDSRFVEWLKQVSAFNQTHGMHSLVTA